MSLRGRPRKQETMEEGKEEDELYVVGKVPTDYETIIYNSDDQEEIYNIYKALAKIMNDLEELKKLLD